MNINIKDILSQVPNFETFFTMEEMDKSTLALAEKYPDVISVKNLGASRKGHPIYCIKIDGGEKTALAFASPHPNEPIGSTMLEFLTEKLASDKEFRDGLGYTWYCIKSVDPDGTKLNEGWFKGPYNIPNYAKNFFRPAGYEQTEWTFPVKYKTYEFNRPIPETKILMDLMQEIKPDFVYSLHNAGFGGVYWYLSEDLKGAYDELYQLVDELELPLRLGEPETPYAKPFAKAVYKQSSITDNYDYIEKFRKIDPATVMKNGAGSFDYIQSINKEAFTLVCEAPYFFNSTIADLSESDILRSESVLKACDISTEISSFLREQFNKIRHLVGKNNNLATAVENIVDNSGSGDETKRKWAKESPECQRPATNAEKFTNMYSTRFYSMLGVGMLARAAKQEIENKSYSSEEEKALLENVAAQAEVMLNRQCEILTSEIDYQVVPVRKLVTIQLASALYFMRELDKKK